LDYYALRGGESTCAKFSTSFLFSAAKFFSRFDSKKTGLRQSKTAMTMASILAPLHYALSLNDSGVYHHNGELFSGVIALI
jgi:hypothetical protein